MMLIGCWRKNMRKRHATVWPDDLDYWMAFKVLSVEMNSYLHPADFPLCHDDLGVEFRIARKLQVFESARGRSAR